MFTKEINAICALVVVTLGLGIYTLQQVPEMPKLDLQRWWGPGSPPKQEDTSIRPFKIDFNDSMVEDLKRRLRNRRPLARPLEGVQSEYGINTVYLEQQLEYWLQQYDFQRRAQLLNQLPHYVTRVQGLDIHYVHAKPAGGKGIPLLMLHGWPSSSKEFSKVIPQLTTPWVGDSFVFEVVAPDLPGFGFSEGTNKPGLNPVEMGIMMRNLMRRLGFKQFYVQGGDWGSQCGTHMAVIFPDEILGFITNMPISSMPISMAKLVVGSLVPSAFEHADRVYPLTETIPNVVRESGYFHLQATKPDTIGVALTDSPVGLAGYVMEKMAMCSDRQALHTPHGGLDNLDIDDVLDTLTIMWASNCVVTATRIYKEAAASPVVRTIHRIPTRVPTVAINFKHEVLYQFEWVLRDKFPNLLRSFTLDFGGHFAALQTPDDFARLIYQAGDAFLQYHSKNKSLRYNIEV